MKVSVAIPIYKAEKYIERCLLSVLTQTWDELEIILVNDCTPDNSMAVVDRVLKESSRKDIVKIINHEKNLGVAVARNSGIKAATGEYFCFVDSDDYIPINAIEILASRALKDHTDFVLGDLDVKGDKEGKNYPLLLPSCILKDNEEILSSFAKFKWNVMPYNKLVRLSLIHSCELYFREGIVHEDDLWCFLLACNAENASVVNEITYYYYIHEGSITTNPSRKNLDSRLIIIEEMYKYIQGHMHLLANPWAYILFEQVKAKYMDRILYFSKDKDFYHKSYDLIRKYCYLSPLEAARKFNLPLDLKTRNIHYLLPKNLGYLYFKLCVMISYKILIAKIKLGLIK